MYLKGFILGTDSKKIEVFRNGVVVAELPVLKPDPTTGRVLWEFNHGDGRGLYELRVTAIGGETYRRYYSFYPRVRSFRWNGETNRYAIPYNMVGNRVNRKLDILFRARGPEVGSSNDSIGSF